MHAFINSKQVSLNLGRFFRVYPQGVLSAETPVDQLIIDTAGESKVLRDYHKLVQESVATGVDESLSEMGIQLVDESQLVKWQHLPVRIGRVSAKLLADELHLHEESAPLSFQCEMLKSRNKGKKHFRVAVVNAFGANLGDTTLGMTALRIAVNIFKQELKSFTVDLFIGPTSHISNKNIIDMDDWVLNVFYESPTLQDFSRYDAYLDFTNLINLPKFKEMPTVDWYLWWMGLDPLKISAEEKRNKLSVPWKIWMELTEKLKGISGKRVLFNAKASVPLRSCPLDVAKKLISKILEKDKNIHILVSHDIELKHPRLTNYQDKLPTAEHFIALISQVDAVITVDTFAVHVADAAAVPCVSLFASVPPSSYPYYPLNEGILIPDGEKLPGYMMSKISNEEEWASMQDDYHKAWSNIRASSLLKAIDVIEDRRKTKRTEKKIEIKEDVLKNKSIFENKDGYFKIKHSISSQSWQDAHLKLLRYAESILKPGMTCIQFGAGSPELSVGIARLLGGLGKFHIFEPRSHLIAMLGLNLANEIASGQIQLSRTLITKESKIIQFESTDANSETNPGHWGNLRQLEKLKTIKIEEVKINFCQLILLQPPIPSYLVLEGMTEFIEMHKPGVAVGPIDKDGLRIIASMLKSLNYSIWAETIKYEREDDVFCTLAFPKEKKVNMRGFKEVKV